MEKKNIGSKLALYPMPVTVVGSMDGDKPEWSQVDHVGIIGHSSILVDEKALDEQGHIDYTKLNLVLFEMSTYSYLEMGGVIGKCTKMH